MILQPHWPRERTELLAATLGFPPGSEWAHIWSAESVPEGRPATLLFKRASQPDQDANRFSLPTEEARPLAGFTFDMIGRLTERPSVHYWQLTPTGGLDETLTIEVWWLSIPIGNGLRALRIHEPLTGADRRSVEVTGDGWEATLDRVGRIKKALRALDMRVAGAGGRHRVGADADDGELVAARSAEAMRREHPTWSWLRIAHEIGLVAAVEDEGRSAEPEQAALRRLERWRKRLREIGE